MSSAAFKKCQSLLPELSPAELEKIRLSIGLLKTGKSALPSKKGKSLDQDDWLAQAIGRAMIQRGQLTKENVQGRLTLAIRRLPNYEGSSAEQRNYLLNAIGVEPREYELQYLGDVVITALLNHIDWMGGIDTDKVMSNIHRIPAALDGELPGYVASGLLGLLLLRIPKRGTGNG